MTHIFAPIPVSEVMHWPEEIAAPVLRANRPDRGGDANHWHLSETELAAAEVPAAHREYMNRLVTSYQEGAYAPPPIGRIQFRSNSWEGHSNVTIETRSIVITDAPRLSSTNADLDRYFVTLLDDDAEPTHTVRISGPIEKKTTWDYEGTVHLEEGKTLYLRVMVPKQRLDPGDVGIFMRISGPGTHTVWGGRSMRGGRALPEY